MNVFHNSIFSNNTYPVLLFVYPVRENQSNGRIHFSCGTDCNANENNQFAVLLLLNGAEFFGVDFLTFFSADQMEALVALFLGLRQAGIFIAQIFWGLWLFPMGYLVFKSGFLPKIIGALLIVAGFGYLIESLILFFVPDFSITITLFTFLGEFLITFWLLIKGVNVEVWNKRALESA